MNYKALAVLNKQLAAAAGLWYVMQLKKYIYINESDMNVEVQILFEKNIIKSFN